jgi:hypothetical protein
MWILVLALMSLSEPSADPTSHLRAASPVVRSLIDEAMVSSAIVNRLVAQLQRSDTIVYVETRDEAGIRQLYQRIGLGGGSDRWETREAGEVERQVRAEQFARRGRR